VLTRSKEINKVGTQCVFIGIGNIPRRALSSLKIISIHPGFSFAGYQHDSFAYAGTRINPTLLR